MPNKPHHHRPPPSSSGGTNLASCAVASIFLIFVVIGLIVVFFTVFRPKDPEISVNSVHLSSFSVANSSATFTFSQYATVRNPNRAAFSHYDSSLQLLHSSNPVGFMFIPAGKIDAGRTQYMTATFTVQSFPLGSLATTEAAELMDLGMSPIANGVGGGGLGNGGDVYRTGPTLEIESKLVLGGRVSVLHFFTHRARTTADCRVTISVTDGSVLGFHC